MDIALERILFILNKRGIKEQAICELLEMSTSTLYNWKKGKSKSYILHLDEIAGFLDVDKEFLLGKTDNPRPTAWAQRNGIPVGNRVMIPVYGAVRAGEGGMVQQELLGYQEANNADLGRNFFLLVKGDSMSPYLLDGDYVLVDTEACVENGDIAVVVINGEEGVVKKVYRNGDTYRLISLNANYPDRVVTSSEATPVYVNGKVVQMYRDIP